MKLNRWVVWVLVVAFLASEVFLFSALHQKEALRISLQAEKQRADDLQAEVDALKDSTAGAQAAEIVRLRADNQDLPRLRNQVTQLQATGAKLQAANQKLTEQLKATAAYARQQQSQLQELAAENRQATAIIQQSDAAANRSACINNLRQIDAAKQMWALEKNKTAEAAPSADDLLPYFKNETFPICPSGGNYTIGAVGELPTCSTSGHALPLR